MRTLALLSAVVVLAPGAALAQVELVDPDVARPGPSGRGGGRPGSVQLIDPDTEGDDPGAAPAAEPEDVRGASRGDDELSALVRHSRAQQDAGARDAGVREAAGTPDVKAGGAPSPREPIAAPEAPAPGRAPPPDISATRFTEADFEAAWSGWRLAAQSRDVGAEKRARQQLVDLKRRAGVDELELHALGLLRAAEVAQGQGDHGAAVEMALTATQLAPSLPVAWAGLALAYVRADPTDPARFLGPLGRALRLTLRDPRAGRPLLASLSAGLLIALTALTVTVLIVLFLRRGWYFLYDFHFFFPRAAARWQTAALALLLLSLPLVTGLGLAPTLLGLFAALTMYLSVRERLVVALLISLVGAIPAVGAWVVERTAFASTPGEDLLRIEGGGAGLQPLVDRYEALSQADKVGFAEHAVLGRFHARRGALELATQHLRRALALRPDDASVKVNLAAALFFGGDLENSRVILESAERSGVAIALFNLGRIYKRRIAVYGDLSAGEVDKANAALAAARGLDPSLPPLGTEELTGPVTGNEYLRTVPLPLDELTAVAASAEAAARVRSQLTQLVLGGGPESLAPLYPAVLSLLLLGLGFLGPSLSVARVCTRCGRAVSRRGDPQVSPGSLLCTQCVNVFVKKNLVPTPLRVRKQLEVARYQSRGELMTVVLGVLWAGMGHLFAGATVRGALYGLTFALAVVAAALRNGVVRAPYDALPTALWLVPLGGAALAAYVASLRGLRKRKG
jgi:Flp pilus assembly protein TadD